MIDFKTYRIEGEISASANNITTEQVQFLIDNADEAFLTYHINDEKHIVKDASVALSAVMQGASITFTHSTYYVGYVSMNYAKPGELYFKGYNDQLQDMLA